MTIGIPIETMNHEHRVGLVPSDVKTLKQSNTSHEIYIQDGLGKSIGYTNADYQAAGAKVLKSAKEIWESAELLVKCKEPIKEGDINEYAYLRKDMILCSFLDLAYSKELATALVDSKVTSICTETIAGPKGNYPVLAPMSEIAGKYAAQLIAHYLSTHVGGMGVLIGGSAGIAPAKVVVLGGGVVGMNAARVLVGMGADVWVLDVDVDRVSKHPLVVENRVKLLYADEDGLRTALKDADGVVGAVLVTATQTPKVMKRHHLKLLKQKAVIIDVACDLGGCIETIKHTTHDEPTYEVDGIIHYGVPNIPGVVARTSSISYSKESLPYVLALANGGLKTMLNMPGAIDGLNAYNGAIAIEGIAKAFNLPYFDTKMLL